MQETVYCKQVFLSSGFCRWAAAGGNEEWRVKEALIK
jgi:hypothetical protein